MDDNKNSLPYLQAESLSADLLSCLEDDLCSLEFDLCQQSLSGTLQPDPTDELLPDYFPVLSLEFACEASSAPDTAPIACSKCNKPCKSRRGLNQHIGKVHCRKKRHSVCRQCGNAFRDKYALRFHVKQVHEQATRVICQLCGEVLYNKYLLPRHMEKMHFQ